MPSGPLRKGQKTGGNVTTLVADCGELRQAPRGESPFADGGGQYPGLRRPAGAGCGPCRAAAGSRLCELCSGQARRRALESCRELAGIAAHFCSHHRA